MALMVNSNVIFGLTIVLSSAILCCNGSVYKVGDSGGWTTMGNVDYKLWSATKTFGVGDVIRFEYIAEFHNVMRVTHAMYKACNASVPMKSYTSGNDSITITSRGHHFFICGVPGHCRAGQKVDINVPRLKANAAPTPSTSIFVSPPVPVIAPSPTASSAVVITRGDRTILLLVALVFVFFLGHN